jgi:low molecular weight phosphotyrosine protein phosphatase
MDRGSPPANHESKAQRPLSKVLQGVILDSFLSATILEVRELTGLKIGYDGGRFLQARTLLHFVLSCSVSFVAEALGTAMKKRVSILCTGNSARSQMAEGLLEHDAGDRFEVESAGTKPGHVRPEAIAVMKELGIDMPIIGQNTWMSFNINPSISC